MEPPDPSDLTALLNRAVAGDASAEEELLPQIYEDLRRVASRVFGAGKGTLQPTILVHDAWGNLIGRDAPWQSRGHFLAIAARAMRQLVAEHARRQRAEKRGGLLRRVTLQEEITPFSGQEADAEMLDDLLTELATLDARHAQIVELRFFAGMTIDEAAQTIGVSRRTVQSDWRMASAWLKRELERSGSGE